MKGLKGKTLLKKVLHPIRFTVKNLRICGGLAHPKNFHICALRISQDICGFMTLRSGTTLLVNLRLQYEPKNFADKRFSDKKKDFSVPTFAFSCVARLSPFADFLSMTITIYIFVLQNLISPFIRVNYKS
jgi:hypothetical protein